MFFLSKRELREKKIIILTDFDGTITKMDVGTALVENFGPKGWKRYEEKWIQGEIGSRYTLEYFYENMTQTTQQLIDFIDSNIEVDESFYDFYSYCRNNKIDLYIVSDGMNFYIDFILKKNKLDDIPYFSNLYIDNGSYVKTKFPYFNEQCGMCGNCKSDQLQKFLDKETYIIYIGDGYTDRCVSGKADLVFAKNDLEKYCRNNNIDYIPYNNFSDVLEVIKSKFS